MNMQKAAALSNTIWLAPLSESLPNVRMVNARNVMRSNMGSNDSHTDGCLTWSFPFPFSIVIVFVVESYVGF